MESTTTLSLAVTTAEFQSLKTGDQKEIYRTATDEWFTKLYTTDAQTGLANVDNPIPFKHLQIESEGKKLLFTFRGIEVEEFMNHPVDSDERFGFVILVGGLTT